MRRSFFLCPARGAPRADPGQLPARRSTLIATVDLAWGTRAKARLRCIYAGDFVGFFGDFPWLDTSRSCMPCSWKMLVRIMKRFRPMTPFRRKSLSFCGWLPSQGA